MHHISIKKFRIDPSRLPRGGYSSIFRVQNIETGEILIAKVLQYNDSNQSSNLSRELEKISSITHPSIIKCIGYSLTDFNGESNPVIFLKFMTNGSLENVINQIKKGQPPTNWNDTKVLINIYGIAAAMSHLHSCGIIHRDLKPGNILEDENFYPKVSDFGLQKKSNSIQQSLSLGTPIYMAPEIISETGKTDNLYKSDVYSFGITVFLLMGGEIKAKNQFNFFTDILKGIRPQFNQQIQKSYRELIDLCWDNDIEKRPSFDEIVLRLTTDPGFITDKIDVDEFENYVKYINEWKNNELNKRKEEEDFNELEKMDTEEEEEEEKEEKDEEKIYSFRKGKPFILDTRILNIKDFKKKEKLGSGLCGNVFKIENISTKTTLAAKIMRHEFFEEDINTSDAKHLSREVTILSQLVHPSIMKFFGYSATDFINLCRPVIITEYLKNGSLEDILEIERGGFKITFWDDTMKLINIYGIASCMSYLHLKNIIHRDLKPSNVLIDEFLFPKLADFGFSKFLSQQEEKEKHEDNSLFQSKQMGTKGFMAPEILSDCTYTKAGDVYSFGMLVYEIMAKKFPFEGKSAEQVMYAVLFRKERPIINNSVALHYKELIEECWKEDPNKRPTFDDIINKLENDQRFLEKIDKKLYFDYIQYIKQLQKDQTILFAIKSDSFKQYSLKPIYHKYKEEKSIMLVKGYVDIDKYVRQKTVYTKNFMFCYNVIDKTTGQVFIAEMSKFDIVDLSSQEKENLLNEVGILSHLKHPTIQQVIGYSLINFKHHPKPVIIREYSTYKTLYDVIEKVREGEKNSKFTDTKKLIIIYGIASGMSYLHLHDILHHELKTKNILVDDNLNPKISEFGFYIKPQNSFKIASESHNFNNNNEIPYYISPEVLKSKTPTKSSDVYSFAYIVYELICNEIPFNNIKSHKQLFDEVVKKYHRPTINENIPKIYRQLISSCWDQDPTKRPTFSSIAKDIRSNEAFITSKIDKNEFNNYVKLIRK